MGDGSESFDVDGDHLRTSASISQFFTFNHDFDVVQGLDHNYSSSSDQFHYCSKTTPKMLCFGGCECEDESSELSDFFWLSRSSKYTSSSSEATKINTLPDEKSGISTCCCCTNYSSSTVSSLNTNNTTTTVTVNADNVFRDISKSSIKKRNGKGDETVEGTGNEAKTDVVNQKTCKRSKTVRKVKLGERIAALQKLVSPYGKTDAASVLHEAMGYIKFLQDQVQILCSPYLHQHLLEKCKEMGENDPQKDLRSRGLCLVPVECTLHLASSNSNGADYWSPVSGSSSTVLSPSITKHQ